jgi:hypothetical protein
LLLLLMLLLLLLLLLLLFKNPQQKSATTPVLFSRFLSRFKNTLFGIDVTLLTVAR